MSDSSLSSSSSTSSLLEEDPQRIWQIDNNHNVINQIANNDPSVTFLEISQAGYEQDPDILQYIAQPDGIKQLDLLGELVGVNSHLKELRLIGGGSGIDPFYAGLSNNKSVSRLSLYWFEDGQKIRLIYPFFKGNQNLTELNIKYCILGREGCRLLAAAIGKYISPLTSFCIDSNADGGDGHSDEDLAVIIQALNLRPQQLQELTITGENIGPRTLAALESLICHATELHTLDLHDNYMHDEVASDQFPPVLAAAMKSSNLVSLKLRQCTDGLDIGEEGIDVLANTLPNNNLMHLNLGGINRGRGGRVDALVMALPMSNLVSLDLSQIDIGKSGVKALARALKTDPLLEKLSLHCCGIRVQGYLALADALANNTHLKEIDLSNDSFSTIRNGVITSGCWMAFLNTLCDTSTVNKTYLSNHTLEDISNQARWLPRDEGLLPRPRNVVSALELNRCDDKGLVRIEKILKHHRHFNIQPFVQWDFKVLPLLLDWLEYVDDLSDEHINETKMRKLTVMYDFVQALPELFVLTYSLQELSSLREEQSKLCVIQLEWVDLELRCAEIEHRLAML